MQERDIVFICYSHKDSEFVNRLVADLKASGICTWRDVDDIPGHLAANTASWRRAVDEALRNCSRMIVVVSPNSIVSAEVEAEWNYFLSQQRPVYPLLCAGRIEDIPYRLYALNCWDLRQNYEGQLHKLSEMLRSTRDVSWSQMQDLINHYRPDWLPQLVTRNQVMDEIPGPHIGGCLLQLPDLPIRGLRRKVILARDSSPLLELVEIPVGKFFMGSSEHDEMAWDWEKPQCEVSLDTYWIARTPVTNLMWQKFVQESGYQPTTDDHDGDYLKHWHNGQPPSDKLEHPVVNVSYIAAWAFCDYYGLMLPSEAQWEKAARGVDGRLWPWGDQPPMPDICNFSNSQLDNTSSVDSFERSISPFGLLNCAGNVWEWCADQYNRYWLKELDPNAKHIVCYSNDRTNRFSLKGGSYSSFAASVRCAFRDFSAATSCFDFFGFRPAQISETALKLSIPFG
jgi:formylglycine-generating enzyme required for sulfatase activity